MKEFNYKRAWNELAYPRYCQLSKDVRKLFELVQSTCGDQRQNSSLGMDWPDGDLEQRFYHVPSEELARALHVIYGLGHWDYDKTEGEEYVRDNHGAYWKFQYFAKQSLTERGFTNWDKYNTSEFMDHKPGTDLNLEEQAELFTTLLSEFFEVMKVDHVNHRVKNYSGSKDGNHPFVIGSKHMANSTGMYLDPSCAPCAHCGYSYEDHESDTVMFVKLQRESDGDEVKLTKPEQKLLKSIGPKMEELKIDGLVFVK